MSDYMSDYMSDSEDEGDRPGKITRREFDQYTVRLTLSYINDLNQPDYIGKKAVIYGESRLLLDSGKFRNIRKVDYKYIITLQVYDNYETFTFTEEDGIQICFKPTRGRPS